ncbi:hypothetical protein SAMN04489868_11252 [Pisciglobus halotolerans]|uniref:Uncharacterized protein n=1 Tax=Pisciglobus halotolerans TaxID=745365 RepID=A0A1I3C379_9LACT|nr:hypothetical protein SAMN04489868_11252 [Pisciglobus halotolerans]
MNKLFKWLASIERLFDQLPIVIERAWDILVNVIFKKER